MLARPGAVGLALRLRDRFADHGLVGVLLAVPDGDDLRVDAWLMSCRVLGRGAELVTMRVLAEAAAAQGRRWLVGEFVPSERNDPASRAYADCGFRALGESGGAATWALDLEADRVPDPGLIAVQHPTAGPAAVGTAGGGAA